MSQYDPKKIEEYQIAMQRDPRSAVFAPLAEAYRKMGLLEEALEVTTRGVRHNPEFVSGLVAHSKVLFALKDYREAITFLKKAHLLKPENLLAVKLLGHCYSKVRRYREALVAFKKLLILSPDDKTALAFIEKWEFLEQVPAGDHPESFNLEGMDNWISKLPSPDKALHLIDSFINYGDNQAAQEILQASYLVWPNNPDFETRQKLIESRIQEAKLSDNPLFKELAFKKEFYEKCLQRIEERLKVDPAPGN